MRKIYNGQPSIWNLYDAFGRKVEKQSGEATTEPLLIDISHLPAGVYTYDISINHLKFNGQIIKE